MKARAGDVYTIYNQNRETYTACQVAYITPPNKVSKQSWHIMDAQKVLSRDTKHFYI